MASQLLKACIVFYYVCCHDAWMQHWWFYSPGLDSYTMPILQDCINLVALECGLIAALLSYLHHDVKWHNPLKHHTVLKGLNWSIHEALPLCDKWLKAEYLIKVSSTPFSETEGHRGISSLNSSTLSLSWHILCLASNPVSKVSGIRRRVSSSDPHKNFYTNTRC